MRKATSPSDLSAEVQGLYAVTQGTLLVTELC